MIPTVESVENIAMNWDSSIWASAFADNGDSWDFEQ